MDMGHIEEDKFPLETCMGIGAANAGGELLSIDAAVSVSPLRYHSNTCISGPRMKGTEEN